jgi:PEP-CTERM motif
MSKKIALWSSLVLVPSLFAGTPPVSPIPEPGTLILLAGGIGAAILLERKRRKKG